MALKKGTEVATIDVALVTIITMSGVELALDTSNKVEVTPSTETTDAVKNIVKGVLIAQKPLTTTITGNEITMTDNVFNPQLVKILQGGTIRYWKDVEHTEAVTDETEFGVCGYTPPVLGSKEKGEVFELCLYSAIYNAAGLITGYEKTTYPNCQGQPVAFSSEDNTFRAPEYTITSAPDSGEAPYDINIVDALPVLGEYKITQNLVNATSDYAKAVISGTGVKIKLTADETYTLATPVITMGGDDISSTVWDEAKSTITLPKITGDVVISEKALAPAPPQEEGQG